MKRSDLDSNLNSWGLIGLGWLGKSLADQLQSQQISYWGTTTQDFRWESDEFPHRDCDILFLNTPPLVGIEPKDFVSKIPQKKERRILFVSSISVYGDSEGRVTEATPVSPLTFAAKWLTQVEELLLTRFPEGLTIIRAGGLIGEDRHPVRSLVKSNKVIEGSAVVNLIHREDLVNIILKLAPLENAPKIINAVCPYHPTKSEYYSAQAKKWGLPPLVFEFSTAQGKVVASDFLKNIFPSWIHRTL
jgi:hypothetical protein